METVQGIMTFLVPFVVGVLAERYAGIVDRVRGLIGR